MLSYHANNPESVYFLNSSKDIYLDGMVLNLILFLASKSLHLLFFLLRKLHRIFLSPYQWMRDNTKWWTFFLMLIESNMMRFAFHATLQFQIFISFNFVTKVCLVLSTLTLIGLLIYSCIFNLTVFKF